VLGYCRVRVKIGVRVRGVVRVRVSAPYIRAVCKLRNRRVVCSGAVKITLASPGQYNVNKGVVATWIVRNCMGYNR
jgi:hypothetical protein